MSKKNYARIYSCHLSGFSVNLVKVEANIKKGIPKNSIVGSPDLSIRESMDRIRIAVENSGFHYPLQNILVNLSPAGLKKSGSFFDLPIITAILVATAQINPGDLVDNAVFIGEAGLDGSVKGIAGIINILLFLKSEGFKNAIIPSENSYEASVVKGINTIPISSIQDLSGLANPVLNDHVFQIKRPGRNLPEISLYDYQLIAFRAMQIALAGRHHIMFMGSPGSGKTMISRLARLLQPEIDEYEFSEILRIDSLKGRLIDEKSITVERPFRSPHHTSSEAAIVGGGNHLQMGEITRAHMGILFLDELGEFKPRVIQALREPMEERKITISRASGNVTYPSSFQLICSTNPCPCGYYKSRERICLCNTGKIKNYLARFNGPFLDRIDLYTELYKKENARSAKVSLENCYAEIQSAIAMQKKRFAKAENQYNSFCTHFETNLLQLDKTAQHCVETMENEYSLRKIHSIKKTARTIADLECSDTVLEKHILEALHYANPANVYLRTAA